MQEIELENIFEIINPEVSKNNEVLIWCVTFNSRDFISNAIKGFLMQKTNYNYHIVIYDDASNDGTSEIVKKLANDNSELITVYLAKKNTYKDPKRTQYYMNIIKKYNNVKYVAFCEGDDVWIDANKLEIQLKYMNSNYDCVMTAHNSAVINYRNDEVIPAQTYSESELDLDIRELMLFESGIRLTTSSIVIKKVVWQAIPLEWEKYGYGDLFLHYVASLMGRVHYFNRIMSAYRMYLPGSWTNNVAMDYKNRIQHFFNLIDSFRMMNKYSKGQYKFIFEIAAQKEIKVLLDMFLNKKNSLFYEIIEECEDNNSGLDKKELIRIYKEINDSSFIDDESKIIFESSRKVYIYGAGNYADLYTSKLLKYGYEYEGFIVSNIHDNKQVKDGKIVCEVEEFAKEDTDSSIIVAINGMSWESIKNVLDKYGLTFRAYNPFIFHI